MMNMNNSNSSSSSSSSSRSPLSFPPPSSPSSSSSSSPYAPPVSSKMQGYRGPLKPAHMFVEGKEEGEIFSPLSNGHSTSPESAAQIPPKFPPAVSDSDDDYQSHSHHESDSDQDLERDAPPQRAKRARSPHELDPSTRPHSRARALHMRSSSLSLSPSPPPETENATETVPMSANPTRAPQVLPLPPSPPPPPPSINQGIPLQPWSRDFEDVRVRTQHTMDAVPARVSFTPQQIPLGLPTLEASKEDIKDALNLGVLRSAYNSKWNYPLEPCLSTQALKVYKTNVAISFANTVAKKGPITTASNRKAWLPRLVIPFYPPYAETPLSPDVFASKVTSWAITNIGAFHLFFNYLLVSDLNDPPSASALVDGVAALQDLIDTCMHYVIVYILIPSLSPHVPTIKAAKETIYNHLGSLKAVYAKYKRKRASVYLTSFATTVANAKFTPKFYIHLAGALTALIYNSDVSTRNPRWTRDDYIAWAPIIIHAARLGMLAAGRPARLSSITGMTMDSLTKARKSTSPDDLATLPFSYFDPVINKDMDEDQRHHLVNHIRFVRVQTKNTNASSDAVHEWLPIPKLSLFMLKKLSAMARAPDVALADNNANSLAFPYWADPTETIPGSADRDARNSDIVKRAIRDVCATLELNENTKYADDWAKLGHSRFVRKHANYVLRHHPSRPSTGSSMADQYFEEVTMGHSLEVGDVHYTNVSHEVDNNLIEAFRISRTILAASEDGPFLRLAVTSLENADSNISTDHILDEDDHNLELENDVLASSTTATSTPVRSNPTSRNSRRTGRTSTKKQWDSVQSQMQNILQNVWQTWEADQRRRGGPGSAKHPTAKDFHNYASKNRTDPRIQRILQTFDKSQISDKISNARKAIIHHRSIDPPAAAILPQQWKQAVFDNL